MRSATKAIEVLRGAMLMVSLVVLAASCLDWSVHEPASGGDADGDGDLDEDLDGLNPPPSQVDVLFVVDNSSSMQEEQEVLSQQIEFMIRELTNPTDRGPETPPSVEDLHIGIVTTDMGTHGYTIMTCNNPTNGDNGVLQAVGRLEGCVPSYGALDCSRPALVECPWLSHSEDHADDGSDPENGSGSPPEHDMSVALALPLPSKNIEVA